MVAGDDGVFYVDLCCLAASISRFIGDFEGHPLADAAAQTTMVLPEHLVPATCQHVCFLSYIGQTECLLKRTSHFSH